MSWGPTIKLTRAPLLVRRMDSNVAQEHTSTTISVSYRTTVVSNSLVGSVRVRTRPNLSEYHESDGFSSFETTSNWHTFGNCRLCSAELCSSRYKHCEG